MTTIEAALTGLIDYAGLYPPAALDMTSAVGNYLAYREQKHAWILGRFVVDIGRLDELREASGDEMRGIPLSVIVAGDGKPLQAFLAQGGGDARIEAVEIKCDEPLTIARLSESLPSDLERYFEIPTRAVCSGTVDVLAAVNARAKLRMGGLTPEALPAAREVAERLHTLADRGVPFKATAGLHHLLRAEHRLTYTGQGPTALMHGFLNVLCAAAIARFGGSTDAIARVLDEQDAGAFQLNADSMSWRDTRWSGAQIHEVRQFFTSFGSCSFTEPIQELEAMGWL